MLLSQVKLAGNVCDRLYRHELNVHVTLFMRTCVMKFSIKALLSCL